MKAGFIGPGKVGVSLARYLIHQGIQVTGFFGGSLGHARDAAGLTGTVCFESLQDILFASDLLFVTVPDDQVAMVDAELARQELRGKIICHTSGSLTSDALAGSRRSGATVCSLHPIYAFSSRQTPPQDLSSIYFSAEGDGLTEDDSLAADRMPHSVPGLLRTLGNPYFIRKKEDAAAYHLANVFVSNLTLALLETGISYLTALDLSEPDAIAAMLPLIQGNIRSIGEKGFAHSLTGPVARGDAQTVRRHLAVVRPEDEGLYRNLSLRLLELARKNERVEQARAYEEMERCLKGEH